jgi:hypothetical protein
MFFSANEPPRIGEQKQSIADRIYPIEMPYRFKAPEDVDAGDPLEKEKTPNIAETMLSDDAAMRGLLALAVEHAQHLVENRGEYSQPESPSERLQKYRRESDPIAKFAAEGLQPADDGMKIRKDDAYRVYRSMAQAWDERPASERGFKRQLPAKFPAEVETAQSRALAMPDDEAERVRCWKRVTWTDKAAKRMPDWLRERYADHFEDDEAADDDAADADTAADTGALDDLDAGRHDVTVTVAEKMDPKPWQQARGHVVDDEGNIMEFVAEGSTNPVSHVEEDDRVEFSNAKAATDRDGILRLEISGVCDVTVTNRDADQSALDDADGDDTAEAAADGGEEPDGIRGAILTTLRDAGEPMKIPELLGAAGVDPGPGRDAVARLAERGDLAAEERDGDTVVKID